jgi:hypothetical protein
MSFGLIGRFGEVVDGGAEGGGVTRIEVCLGPGVVVCAVSGGISGGVFWKGVVVAWWRCERARRGRR